MGNDGQGGGRVITNAELGYDWSTYPERLQRSGITWKIYQDAGVGLDAAGFWGWTSDPYVGNFAAERAWNESEDLKASRYVIVAHRGVQISETDNDLPTRLSQSSPPSTQLRDRSFEIGPARQ